MCVTITNTGSPTPVRGDLLAGFFFSISNADPSLVLASGTGTVVQTGQTAFTGNLLASATNGAYALVQAPGSTLGTNANGLVFPYEYGVATVGDSGIFPGGSVGGDDYALVAPGTNIGANKLGGLRFVQTSATFVISGVPVNFDPTLRITNVALSFGSLPDVVIAGQVVAPEPRSLVEVLAGLSLGGVLLSRRRRTQEFA